MRLRGVASVPATVAAWEPLAPLCGAAPATAGVEPLVRRALARGRGGRSWWTTWIVRRITWVRTSATCVPDPDRDPDPSVAGLSAKAASAPAASAAARDAIRELVGRRGISVLSVVCNDCAERLSKHSPRPGKALAKLCALVVAAPAALAFAFSSSAPGFVLAARPGPRP